MNTCHLAASQDLEDYELAEDSVINYGIPDLTGKTTSGLNVFEVETAIRQRGEGALRERRRPQEGEAQTRRAGRRRP